VLLCPIGYLSTYKEDPISKFKLESEHHPRIGEKISALGRPTAFLMEGGYAVEEIGINAVGVLTGFEGAG
jgi:acetoin utilization deacetylase AcuC-like enzyme